MSGLVEQNSKAQRSHPASLFNTLGEKGAEPLLQGKGDVMFYYVSALIFRKCPAYEILRNIAELLPTYEVLSAFCISLAIL